MKMKKMLALLMALAMLAQVCFVLPAFAADPVVNVTWRDENGNETQFTLPAGAVEDHLPDYRVENKVPDHSIEALVYNDDGRIIMEIEGNIVLVSTNEWESALTMYQHTEAHVEGDVSGGVTATHSGGISSDSYRADSTLESSTYKPEVSNASIQIVGDVTNGASSQDVIVATDKTTVEVTGDVTGTGNSAAIVVTGDATVTVTGDVTTENGPAVRSSGDNRTGYTAYYDATGTTVVDMEEYFKQSSPTVTITGDVTTDSAGIIAQSNTDWDIQTVTNADGSTTETENAVKYLNDATITVNGNVTVSEGGNGNAIYAEGTSEVTIVGDVIADSETVRTSGDSKVHVTGDVTSREGDAILTRVEYENSTIVIERDSGGEFVSQEWTDEKPHAAGSVIVDGNVQAKNNAIDVQTNVTVGGSVSSENGTGITATGIYDHGTAVNQAIITVAGDVTAGFDGIRAGDQVQITVDGNVTAGQTYQATDYKGNTYTTGKGSGIQATDSASVTVDGSVSAVDYGVTARDNASVVIGGDLEAGHTVEGSDYSFTMGTAVQASGSASVVVDGNVSSQAYGLNAGDANSWNRETINNADGTNTTVTTSETQASQVSIEVGGDLTAGTGGIVAYGNSEVTVGGDVSVAQGAGVQAYGAAQVSIEGDLETEDANGIYARKEELGKTVSSRTWDSMTGEVTDTSYTYEVTDTLTGAEVKVAGDVTTKEDAAIDMDGVSRVIVWGDVTGGDVEKDSEEETEEETETMAAHTAAFNAAKEETFADVETTETVNGAVEITLEEENNDGLLIVGGTITANGDSIPLVVTYTIEDTADQTKMPELPEIKVYEIAPQGEDYFDVNVILTREMTYDVKDELGNTDTYTATASEAIALTEEEKSELINTIAAAIQYIIKIDESIESGVINISDDFYDAENGIYTAHEGEAVTVTLSSDVYNTLTATGNYTLTQNADGSWTLTVERGGGVTLSARIEKKTVEAAMEKAAEEDKLDDSRIGKTIYFGRYDLDGDGKLNELAWRVTQIKGGYAKLALISGMENTPADFLADFTEQERADIRDQKVTELAEKTVRWMFGDGKVHLCIEVNLDALNL